MPSIDDDIKLGAREGSRETRETTRNLKKDRSLIVAQLTSEPPMDPAVITNVKTINEVFEKYQPGISVDFEREDGQTVTEEIHFKGLNDFGPVGIKKQSPFLMQLELEQEFLGDMVRQLKSNKTLKTVLENNESRQAFLKSLDALMSELD